MKYADLRRSAWTHLLLGIVCQFLALLGLKFLDSNTGVGIVTFVIACLGGGVFYSMALTDFSEAKLLKKEEKNGRSGQSSTNVSSRAPARTGGPTPTPVAGAVSRALHQGGAIRASQAASTGASSGVNFLPNCGCNQCRTARGEEVKQSVTDVTLSDAELDVVTKPVVGYRFWSPGSPLPYLISSFNGTPWKPGRNQAHCFASYETRAKGGAYVVAFTEEWDGAPHDDPNHLCGLHAVVDPYKSMYGNGAGTIFGGVVGWGKVVEGPLGWRAQFAQVAAILETPIFLEDVVDRTTIMGSELPTKPGYAAELYGVPLVHSLEALTEKTEQMASWMAGEDLAHEAQS